MNGRVCNYGPLPRIRMENDSGNPSTGNLDRDGVEPEPDEEEEDGDIQNQVEKFLNKDNDKDSEDGPSWMFEEGETLSRDPDYIFCPAPHHKGILRLFTRHFCQHPLLPERDGKLSAVEIRCQAVYDMYNFCRVRGIREVWGYMWSSWYSPKMWCLWARSTSPRISRLRTTMAVENFWRQLKHNYLHNVAHPRLDHLVWILINRVTPAYLARSEILDNNFRLGRTRPLQHIKVTSRNHGLFLPNVRLVPKNTQQTWRTGHAPVDDKNMIAISCANILSRQFHLLLFDFGVRCIASMSYQSTNIQRSSINSLMEVALNLWTTSSLVAISRMGTIISGLAIKRY